MRSVLLLLSLLFVSPISPAGETKEYVGLVYPPIPSGLVEKGGGLAIGNASSDGLWYSYVEIDGKPMIWLVREIGRSIANWKDRPIWQVEDTLAAPSVSKGETIHHGNDIECFFKGSADTSIIAVGKWAWRVKQVGGYSHHIRLAWRVNPVLKKFEAISPRDVRCELNEDRD